MSLEPSRYVQPELGDARVNRLWGNVSARLEARRGRLWRGIALSLTLSAAVAGAVFFTQSRLFGAGAEHAVLADAKLETAGDSLAVTLVDGSQVSLASRSEVRVRGNQPSAVALQLGRGEVTCDVTHRENRKFTVVAGDVEVRVVGTKFTVKTTPGDNPRVEVSVLRGVVEVASQRRPGIVARVAAGQSWIQNPEPSVVAARGVSSADAVAPVTEPQTRETDANADASADVKSAGAPATSATPAGPSARDLFEKAGESRRAGDAAAAARAYEELLRLHPGDGRASLSAFELGRLRMDRLGDRAGAIAALERALASKLGPSFREDALARLVSVYAAQANYAACGRARDRYLASYPDGVHAAAVATRCGTR
jgi:transmembrane sensor